MKFILVIKAKVSKKYVDFFAVLSPSLSEGKTNVN